MTPSETSATMTAPTTAAALRFILLPSLLPAWVGGVCEPTQTASHAPSLGLGRKSGPIILLIRAGFASDRLQLCATR